MISPTSNDKSNDWSQPKTLRRFPENNNLSNSINNNIIKSEIHQSSLQRSDCEEERKSKSLYTPHMKPSNLKPSESDPVQHRTYRKSVNSDSSSNTLIEEPSFSNSTSLVSNQSKTAPAKLPKPQILSIGGKLSQPKVENAKSADSLPNQDTFVASVLKSGEYLLKDQWNTFVGSESLKQYSKKIIERNDNIWEMVSLHYGCLNRLVILKEVYADSYPRMESGLGQTNRNTSAPSDRMTSLSDQSNYMFDTFDSIVPGLKPLIKCFATITNSLIENHVIRHDRVITEIGRVLNESITDELCSELAKLYGHFNFQRQTASQKINQFKKYPNFLSYIHACERNPRSEKKTLSDYTQDISMFWARMTVPLNVIIDKTINDSQELNYLIKYKEKIQKLITEAENISGKFANAQILKTIIENYERNPDSKESDRVYEFMTGKNSTLIYKGEVQCELRKGNAGRVVVRELTGVALENCLFFLISVPEPVKNTVKYQLFQDRDKEFPALLEWGHLYGYFREEDSKNTESFSFYLIIEKPIPSIRRFFVSTTTERNCWKNCMMQGFSRWQNENSIIKNAEDKLNEELVNISVKWKNTQHGIDLIKSLDNSLKVQMEYRTVGFRCILEEELKRLSVSGRNSTTSTLTIMDNESKRDMNDFKTTIESYIPDLSTQEGINDWLDVFLEWVYKVYRILVNRLKFSLCSSGANITRSASEIEARKRPSIQAVKKHETFTSHDSPTYEKRPADVPFLNQTITKQKKDQRRISVTGFTNLFRISSKNVKHDDIDKGNESANQVDSVGGSDKDVADQSSFDTDVESDSFMSNLSKDTVAAFNEINVAAKNITIEMMRLRTQHIDDQTLIKKLKDENKVYKDFTNKILKSADNQIGSSTSSIHTPSLISFSTPDVMSESIESSTDNPLNQISQMAECRRQTENLRQMYEQFASEKKKWEKEYESQKIKIEKEKDSISEQNIELKRRKEKLIEEENKHKDKCLLLQKKMDMYKQHGITLDEEVELHTDERKPTRNSKMEDKLQSSPHSRSHSDDVSHKHSSSAPISPPLASIEIASYSVDSRSHIPDPVQNSQIPDQLRGSLINQERQSLKTNSSDNILDSRPKHGNSQAQKMTPSIERKERFSNNNACFMIDDEEKNWSSDIDDVTFHQRKTVGGPSNAFISKPEDSSLLPSTPSVSTRVTSVYNNQTPSLGIPLNLAEKSKVKNKNKKIFKIK